MSFRFGNDPAKTERYRRFWTRESVERPLIGFSRVGWFPLQYFDACSSWKVDDIIKPEDIRPGEWLEDHERLLQEGEEMDDDILRGACPTQVAFPVFIPAMLGSDIRVLPDNVIGEEMLVDWSAAFAAHFDPKNPWVERYLDFARALAEKSGGDYPVSHGAEQGPTDLFAVLRGHNQSLIDLIDEPDNSIRLVALLGDIFAEFTQAVWDIIPLYHGGYFDAQYQLWAPGPIARLQEDATAVYSPDLYRSLVQPVDRRLASLFSHCFMHLHTTSLFLLDLFLEIDELPCLEINIEPFNISVREMIPYLQRVQSAGKSLLVRGSVSEDEFRLLIDSLEPEGLYLHILVDNLSEVKKLRVIAGM